MDSKPRVVGYGGSEGYIKLEGFSKKDLEKILSSMQIGACWVRVKDGKLETVNSWEPAPNPIRDEEMLPFWRKATEVENAQLQLFEMETLREHDSPSISIQHLCGYNYSPQSYKMWAERLESYGFQCMRSRRGSDAKYWEVWFLSGLWAAKGDLKDKIGSHKGKNALKLATSFLSRNVQFGTLDVSIQRMCMVIE